MTSNVTDDPHARVTMKQGLRFPAVPVTETQEAFHAAPLMVKLLRIKSRAPSFPARHLLQELSKIAMPVIFNEPLSFLQRLSEYMEHTHLVHQANATSDSIERMKVTHLCMSRRKGVVPLCAHPKTALQCVAAFAVSAVASQWERTGKPFNPLLGETFELIR